MENQTCFQTILCVLRTPPRSSEKLRPGAGGVRFAGMGFMGGTGVVVVEEDDREEEGLFKTNAVWRRWWRKEQEEREMNKRRGGKSNCKLVSYRGTVYLVYCACKRD